MDDWFINNVDSSSEDECGFLTKPNSQESNLPFSQSNTAIEFESYWQPANSNRKFFSTVEDAHFSSDNDEDQFFSNDNEEVSVGSVDLDCDDDVDVEVIDDIPESGRIMKTIEDYDLQVDFFWNRTWSNGN